MPPLWGSEEREETTAGGRRRASTKGSRSQTGRGKAYLHTHIQFEARCATSQAATPLCLCRAFCTGRRGAASSSSAAMLRSCGTQPHSPDLLVRPRCKLKGAVSRKPLCTHPSSCPVCDMGQPCTGSQPVAPSMSLTHAVLARGAEGISPPAPVAGQRGGLGFVVAGEGGQLSGGWFDPEGWEHVCCMSADRTSGAVLDQGTCGEPLGGSEARCRIEQALV